MNPVTCGNYNSSWWNNIKFYLKCLFMAFLFVGMCSFIIFYVSHIYYHYTHDDKHLETNLQPATYYFSIPIGMNVHDETRAGQIIDHSYEWPFVSVAYYDNFGDFRINVFNQETLDVACNFDFSSPLTKTSP